jgi:hypothetical protein
MPKKKYLKRKQKRVKKFLVRYLLKNNNFKYPRKAKKKKLLFLRKQHKKLLKKKVSSSILLKNKFLKKIDIRVTQNNLFCTFIDLARNKTLHNSSSGIYRIKISKRKLKHFFTTFLLIFFKKAKKFCKNYNNTIFNITAPIRIRKKICKIVKKQLRKVKKKKSKRKKTNVIINVVPKKCFNGCRAKKKIRKKRRLYRIYKY